MKNAFSRGSLLMHSRYETYRIALAFWDRALKRRALCGIMNVSGEIYSPAGTLKTEKRSGNAIPYK